MKRFLSNLFGGLSTTAIVGLIFSVPILGGRLLDLIDRNRGLRSQLRNERGEAATRLAEFRTQAWNEANGLREQLRLTNLVNAAIENNLNGTRAVLAIALLLVMSASVVSYQQYERSSQLAATTVVLQQQVTDIAAERDVASGLRDMYLAETIRLNGEVGNRNGVIAQLSPLAAAYTSEHSARLAQEERAKALDAKLATGNLKEQEREDVITFLSNLYSERPIGDELKAKATWSMAKVGEPNKLFAREALALFDACLTERRVCQFDTVDGTAEVRSIIMLKVLAFIGENARQDYIDQSEFLSRADDLAHYIAPNNALGHSLITIRRRAKLD